MTETLTTATPTAFKTIPVAIQALREPGFASALRAGQCAQRVAEGYLKFDSAFRVLTERAAERFAERDWQGSQQDALDRAELYDRILEVTTADIRTFFSDLMYQPAQWQAVKRNFASLISDLPDGEFCKGFFNAITQRLFRMIGVPQHLEFTDLDAVQEAHDGATLRRLTHRADLQITLAQMLNALPIEADWQDAEASAARISEAMQARLQELPTKPGSPSAIEWLDTVFYRFTRAYVIGRIHTDGTSLPFALALANGEAGVVIDALIMQQTELDAVFSHTRACFHAELDQVAPTTAYLQALTPGVAHSEIIAMLGWPTRIR